MAMPVSGLCMGCMSHLGDYIVCPRCGYDNSAPYDKNYKKPGSMVGSRYIVGRLIRRNGEGALYVGYDNNLQCRVWIREYYPHTIAVRNPMTGDITPKQGFGAQYKALLSDFVDICNEVKRLCVTEPVIPIENMVGEQGTIYAIYKDKGVISLESWLGKRGGKLPVKEACELLLPLYNTLANIHTRSDIHRGISPYSVYIDKSNNLYLWDFCMSAARTGGSELEAELFNGYTAPEQYAASGWQGTWTDVYGAAALFYRVVSGFVPPKSTLIGEQRPLAPLLDLVMDIPKNISDAVARAMDPDTTHRTQEMGAFVGSIVNTKLSNTAVYDVGAASEIRRVRQQKREQRAESRRRGKYVILGMLITVAAIIAVMYIIMTTYFPELLDDPISGSPSSATEENTSPSEEDTTPSPQIEGEMPRLIGMTREDVEKQYGERFDLSIREDYSELYGKGVIYDQSPGDGVIIADGRTVILYVSKGKRRVVMPELVGLAKDDARLAMQALTEKESFDVPYTEIDKYFEEAEPGTVVETKPAAGEEFDPQVTRVTIFYMLEEESGPEETSRSSPESREEETTRTRPTEDNDMSDSRR